MIFPTLLRTLQKNHVTEAIIYLLIYTIACQYYSLKKILMEVNRSYQPPELSVDIKKVPLRKMGNKFYRIQVIGQPRPMYILKRNDYDKRKF